MGGPATVPTFPPSLVPRAYTTVRGVRQFLSTMPFSVLRPGDWGEQLAFPPDGGRGVEGVGAGTGTGTAMEGVVLGDGVGVEPGREKLGREKPVGDEKPRVLPKLGMFGTGERRAQGR